MVRDRPRPRKRKQEQKRLGKFINGRCGPFVAIVLHRNLEGISATKICVVSQLATRNRVLIILQRETACTNSDQLVIPQFTSVGLVSSRKHGLATFVHEKLSWALNDRSQEGSAIDWLHVDDDGCRIVSVYKSSFSRLKTTAILMFAHPCVYDDD